MNVEKTSAPVGILNINDFAKYCSLTRFYPQPSLQHYIEHYWYITWQLPKGKNHQQSVIPHPNTHLIFLRNQSHIQGVCKKKYNHSLTGVGHLMGVKFTPAGFYAFAKHADLSMNKLSDKVVSIDDVFNVNGIKLESEVFSLTDPLEKIAHIDNVLISPIVNGITEDKNIVLINMIVTEIEHNSNLMKVSDVSHHFSIPQRKLQRLFAQYIGVTVKWVISRYRIHEALTKIDNIENNKPVNWINLAIQLGYYDQAHFIHAFSQLIGQTPNDYQRSLK